MTKSKIEWTDETWNPVVGCSLVSPGCTNCYAMRTAHRMDANPKTPQYHGLTKMVKGNPVWTGTVRLHEPALLKPLSWKKPRRVFVNSMGDLFHEDVEDEWIDRVFAVMALCPQHTFQILTKRSDRMYYYMGIASLEKCAAAIPSPSNLQISKHEAAVALTGGPASAAEAYGYKRPAWPLPNVWLGVSAEDQKRAAERIPDLLRTPAAVRFVSAEPLLGPIDFTSIDFDADSEGNVLKPDTLRELWENHFKGTGDEAFEEFCDWYNVWYASPEAIPDTPGTNKIDWIIAGGESGPDARPMHVDWVRSIRDQCVEAGTAFFFKQWGEYRQASEDEIPQRFGHDCDAFHTICRNGVVLPLSLESAFLHKPSRYPKCFPNGADGDANCEPVTVFRSGKKAAGRSLDGRIWRQYPEGSDQA